MGDGKRLGRCDWVICIVASEGPKGLENWMSRTWRLPETFWYLGIADFGTEDARW